MIGVWTAEELERVIDALAFYAEPETYFAIRFFPDHSTGEFINDFSDTDLGQKPGRRARIALGWEPKPIRLFYTE